MSLRSIVLGCCLLASAFSLAACGDDDGGDDGSGSGGNAGSGNAGSGSGNAGRDGNAGSGNAGRGGTGGSPNPNGGSGGAGSAGVGDGDITPVANLSADDVEALCGELNTQLSATVSEEDAARLSCTLLALFTNFGQGQQSLDRAECEQSVTDCLNSNLDEGTTETTCDPASLQAAAEGCTTTVEEYSACLQASVEQLGTALDAFTCETLSDPDTAMQAFELGEMADLPECAGIQQECPALLQGAGSSNGMPSESGCEDSCGEDNFDEFCDDGGEGSQTSFCPLGTDCTDCGPR